MEERGSVIFEIEKLLAQVFIVALTIAAASLTRRGIYGHDSEAVGGGFALALLWTLTLIYARWRQGPNAWWLLITAPVVLAMPVTQVVMLILR